MKTKYLQTNPDTGQTEAFVALSNQEIIFLKEVVKMYDDKRLDTIKKFGLKNYVKNDSQTSELLLILAYY